MQIQSVKHRGLKRLIERDEQGTLDAMLVERVRSIISFLFAMESIDDVRTVPAWRAHILVGNRKGTWSLTVRANWRITFRVDAKTNQIVDLNLEDYH